MNLKNKFKSKKMTIGFITSLWLFGFCWASSVKVIENPKPTHVEKRYVKLLKFQEIKADIDDEHFMAQPISLAVGNDGDFFVFDRLVRKIFKFTENGRFVKVFGNSGQGPGEYGKKFDSNWLYFGSDGYLYLSSTANKKIIKYSQDGAFVSEFKCPSPEYSFGPFFPTVSPTGDYLLLNGPKGTIDAFKELGEQPQMKYSLLGAGDYNRSVFLEVRDQDLHHWRFPTIIDTVYDYLKDGRTIVYLAKTSTIHIYQESLMQKKFNLWPKLALQNYREKIERRKKILRPNDIFIVEMFHNFFLDKDTLNHFYLSSIRMDNKQKYGIYKFSIDGNLEKVLVCTEKVLLKAKKNNIYYGLHEGNILLMKEETSK